MKFWGWLARMALAEPPECPSMCCMILYLTEFPKRRGRVHQALLTHAWKGYLVRTPPSGQSQSKASLESWVETNLTAWWGKDWSHMVKGVGAGRGGVLGPTQGSVGSSAYDLRCFCFIAYSWEITGSMKNRNLGSKDLHWILPLTVIWRGKLLTPSELSCLSAIGSSNAMWITGLLQRLLKTLCLWAWWRCDNSPIKSSSPPGCACL